MHSLIKVLIKGVPVLSVGSSWGFSFCWSSFSLSTLLKLFVLIWVCSTLKYFAEILYLMIGYQDVSLFFIFNTRQMEAEQTYQIGISSVYLIGFSEV